MTERTLSAVAYYQTVSDPEIPRREQRRSASRLYGRRSVTSYAVSRFGLTGFTVFRTGNWDSQSCKPVVCRTLWIRCIRLIPLSPFGDGVSVLRYVQRCPRIFVSSIVLFVPCWWFVVLCMVDLLKARSGAPHSL